MNGINVGRVILGGLVAGLIIDIVETMLNLVIFGSTMEEVYATLNIEPPGSWAIAGFMILGFVIGITTVSLYAAIRPRFGPGPRTAVMAALAVWVLGYFVPIAGDTLVGVLPTGLGVTWLALGLIEIILAALAGGWVYSEAGQPAG